MGKLSFRDKVRLGECDPVVLIRGAQENGTAFYAYLSLSAAALAKLNTDRVKGGLVRLAEYGKVILEGTGEPQAQQRDYMARYYGFSDAPDENNP